MIGRGKKIGYQGEKGNGKEGSRGSVNALPSDYGRRATIITVISSNSGREHEERGTGWNLRGPGVLNDEKGTKSGKTGICVILDYHRKETQTCAEEKEETARGRANRGDMIMDGEAKTRKDLKQL